MSEERVEFIESVGGAKLAVHRIGEGRPVVLLHGLFSSALVNWIKFGHAAKLAAAGFEAIMPDLRAHGQSDALHAFQPKWCSSSPTFGIATVPTTWLYVAEPGATSTTAITSGAWRVGSKLAT